MEILQLDAQISVIDHDLLGVPRAGCSYVVRGEQVALVETGTSLTVENTLAGLERLGVAREAVGHILCTHIHVDHAGGAGYLARALPNATVYIHSTMAEHLADPSRLLVSARRAIGEEAWPLHGDMLPIAPERIQPSEALRLDLGRGVELEALPTPGHSPDHVSFHERGSGALFVGDAVGLGMHEWGLVRPVTPPPGYDLPTQLATIAALRARDWSRLLTHFGPSDDVAGTLASLDEQLQALAASIHAAFIAGETDQEALTQHLLPVDSSQAVATIATAWARMSVAGLLRWEQKNAKR